MVAGSLNGASSNVTGRSGGNTMPSNELSSAIFPALITAA